MIDNRSVDGLFTPADDTDGRARFVPRPAHLHDLDRPNAAVLLAAAVGVASVAPAAVMGAALWILLWRSCRASLVWAWLAAAVGAVTAWATGALAIGWPWELGLHAFGLRPAPPTAQVVHSLPAEVLLGPLLVALVVSSRRYWRRTDTAQGWMGYKATLRTRRAAARAGAASTAPFAGRRLSVDHPPGAIRLALTTAGRPFDVEASKLMTHATVVGTTGFGKTTTVSRIVDGALGNGFSVVVVDGKAGRLRDVARSLAQHHDVPFSLVDPQALDTLGYDPCVGSPASVANKLVGAFSWSADAEVYKTLAMAVLPAICDALVLTGHPVSLETVTGALYKGDLNLGKLGRTCGDEELRRRIERLDPPGALGAQAYEGLATRLLALQGGVFGPVFRSRPALDWRRVTSERRLTYLGLPTTGAGEDVELFARVICQDMKAVCSARLQLRSAELAPVLVVFDEFGGLREADQIKDLLTQAREAAMAVVVAGQWFPLDDHLRKALLGAGLLVSHSVNFEDAQLVADEVGTRFAPEFTRRVHYETGESEEGSHRYVKEFVFHPDDIRALPPGMAVVRVRDGYRTDTVQIIRPTESGGG